MSLEARKEALRREISRKERHLASLDAMPDFSMLDNGSVLGLSVSLGRSRPYSFVAYKVAGQWYLTGANSPNGVSSDYLAEWLVSQGRRLHSATVLAEFVVEAAQIIQVIDLGGAIDSLLSGIDRDEAVASEFPDNL